jgi:hypothetical protein
MPVVGKLAMRWDPKHLEIRTNTVEKAIEPLVYQVCDLHGRTTCTVARLAPHYRQVIFVGLNLEAQLRTCVSCMRSFAHCSPVKRAT